MRGMVTVGAAILVVVALGVGGYVVGESAAPSTGEADDARRSAYETAENAAKRTAFGASRHRGAKEGLLEGEQSGAEKGLQAGSKDGKAAAAEEVAAAAAALEAAATPEALCADSIGDPGAYAQCLEAEGQDPGAPLTDYCAANPEIEAQAGFCPSLNE